MTSFRNPQDPLNFKCFEMLNRESFVDVTLIADGRFMQCHKLVLAASSEYFEEIFTMIPDKQPAIVLKDVSYTHLQQMLQYVYVGSVTLKEEDTKEFKEVLESLKIPFEEDAEADTNGSERLSEGELSPLRDDEMDEMDDINVEDHSWMDMKVKEEPDDPEHSETISQHQQQTDQPHHSRNPVVNISKSLLSNSNVFKFIRLKPNPNDTKISIDRVVPSKKIQKFMNDQPRTCPFCEKLFKTSKHRNEHVKYCFQNPNRVVSICPFCKKNVCDPYYLRKHIRNVHGPNSLGNYRKSAS